MIVGVLMVLVGIGVPSARWYIPLGLSILFGCDAACVIGSIIYRSGPVNGEVVDRVQGEDGWSYDVCSDFNWSTHKYNPPVRCIAPTPPDNPYEKQPLHPLKWIAQAVLFAGDTLTGAISVKVR